MPLLLAANHPNSFLDAIILGSLFKHPVHFLARGDAFSNPLIKKLLIALKLIPIYRLKEGREYLALNDATFEKCRNVLLTGGTLLIFSEGLCVNDFGLRPLKKGTARIALDAWLQPGLTSTFTILPVSISYNFFKGPGKHVILHFGERIAHKDLPAKIGEGETIQYFNQLLYEKLISGLLIVSNSDDRPIQMLISNSNYIPKTKGDLILILRQKLNFAKQLNIYSKIKRPFIITVGYKALLLNAIFLITFFPIVIVSYLFHGILYYPLKKIVNKKTNRTVFFDSTMFALLMLLYPVYLLIFLLATYIFSFPWWCKIIIITMPFIAWIHINWIHSLQRLSNYCKLSKSEKNLTRKLFG